MSDRVDGCLKVAIVSSVIGIGLALALPHFMESLQKAGGRRHASDQNLSAALSYYVQPDPLLYSEMASELVQAWERLESGKIIYEPSRRMRQGRWHEVRIRLTNSDVVPVEDFPWPVTVQGVRLSPIMESTLSSDANDFKIDARSTVQQALVDPYTDWVWSVQPLRSGSRELHLRVVAILPLESGFLKRDVVVKTATIDVDVDPAWLVEEFITEHWRWLFGSPVAVAIFAWAVRKWSRKRRPAGFA